MSRDLNSFLINFFILENFRPILDCFVLWSIPTKDYPFILKKSLQSTRAKNVMRFPLMSTQLLTLLSEACCKVSCLITLNTFDKRGLNSANGKILSIFFFQKHDLCKFQFLFRYT